jgi:hypothetical protein
MSVRREAANVLPIIEGIRDSAVQLVSASGGGFGPAPYRLPLRASAVPFVRPSRVGAHFDRVVVGGAGNGPELSDASQRRLTLRLTRVRRRRRRRRAQPP